MVTSARRHGVFLVLMAAGIGVRVLVMLTYRPAFWYAGDSGAYLMLASGPLRPDGLRALGYVLFLKAFLPLGATVPVVVAQHLLGLMVAVMAYALLLRRGVARWLSCVVTAPLLLDGALLTMEHYLLSETLYTALLVAAVAVLLWRPAAGARAGLVAGVLLATAWFVRPLVLPTVVVLVLWLLTRRHGLVLAMALAIAFAVPYLVIQSWVDGRPSPYGSNALALYGRTAQVAECGQLKLSVPERRLCTVPGQRPDWYAWNGASPGRSYLADPGDPLLRQFALAVIQQQPGAYLRTVGREVTAHFVPWVDPGHEYACLPGRYAMPVTAREPETGPLGCHPELARATLTEHARNPAARDPGPTGTSVFLAWYSRMITTPRLLSAFVVLLSAVAFIKRKRGDPSLGRDAALLAVAAVAAIALPVVVGMYDPRYAIPALPMLAISAGFAGELLRSLRPKAPRRVGPARSPVRRRSPRSPSESAGSTGR